MLTKYLFLFAATSLALPFSASNLGRQASDTSVFGPLIVTDPLQPVEEGPNTQCISLTGEVVDPSLCIKLANRYLKERWT